MQTKKIKIKILRPAEYNPRTITKKRLENLKEQLKNDPDFLEVRPLIVNTYRGRENIVIAGNQRLAAAKELGWETIPCILVKVPIKKEKEWNLKDNNEWGEWEWDLLNKHFDVDLMFAGGFSSDEIDKVFNLNAEDVEDEPQEIPSKPKSKTGEIYELGPHRLMCGSSTDARDVAKLMNGEEAQLLFTDPPYNVNYDPKSMPKHSNKWKKLQNDNLPKEEFITFLTKSLENAYNHTKNNASIYCFCGYTTLPDFVTALDRAGWSYNTQIIWLKEHFVMAMGATFHRAYEPILYGWKKGQTKKVNHSIRNVTDFWNLSKKDFKDTIDIWYEHRDKIKDYKHPTQKPVRLSMRAMALSTDHGDIVLDLFGGSGSTLMGAERAGRRAYIMELDPTYCDVIRNRYEQYTNKNQKAQG